MNCKCHPASVISEGVLLCGAVIIKHSHLKGKGRRFGHGIGDTDYQYVARACGTGQRTLLLLFFRMNCCLLEPQTRIVMVINVSHAHVARSIGCCSNLFRLRTATTIYTLLNHNKCTTTQPSPAIAPQRSAAQRRAVPCGAVPCAAVPCTAVRCCAVLRSALFRT